MSNAIIGDSNIPTSYTTSPDRPFEPIGVRDQYLELHSVPNERLSDEQVQELANEPHFNNDTSRIDKMTKEANEKELKDFEERKLYNLSVKEIAYRISDSWHDILDDMLHFSVQDGARGFLEIFLAHDRLIYIGITIMIFTIAAALIQTAN